VQEPTLSGKQLFSLRVNLRFFRFYFLEEVGCVEEPPKVLIRRQDLFQKGFVSGLRLGAENHVKDFSQSNPPKILKIGKDAE
jgi:hypothetical protein